MIERLHAAARPDQGQPATAREYVATVRQHAYRVTDRDIGQLRANGFSEDEIFELTVATAVAAGLERLEAGLAALR